MSTQISISPVIKLEVNTTPITGGSAGQILFQTTGNTVGESANLFWDATNNRLGIGTSSPATKLHIKAETTSTSAIIIENPSSGSVYLPTTTYVTGLNQTTAGSNNASYLLMVAGPGSGTPSQGPYFQLSGNLYTGYGGQRGYMQFTSGQVTSPTGNDGKIAFNCASSAIDFNTAGTNKLSIQNNGNVLIGTTTDAGFLLDVNGTARVQGALTASSLINIVGGSTTLDRDGVFLRVHGTSGIKLTTWNAGYVDALTVQATTGNVGIGTSSPVTNLSVNGSIWTQHSSLIGSGFNTSTWNYIKLYDNTTGDASIVLYNIGWWLRHNANASIAGKLLLGTTTDAGYKLDVNGTARATSFTASPALVSAWANSVVFARFGHTSFNGSTSFGFMQSNAGDCYVNGPHVYLSGGSTVRLEANGSERMRVFSSGNVGINTTADSGLRLDVNGTAWVQDILYVSNQGVGTTTAFIGGKVVIGSELTNAGYAVKIRSTNTGVAGMYLRGGGGSGYPVMFCQDYNGTTSTTFMVSEIGSVSIGIDSVNASAKLQVDSTTKGFLPPRMTTTQKNAIATPATGLMIYDTDLNRPCFYNGSSWITL